MNTKLYLTIVMFLFSIRIFADKIHTEELINNLNSNSTEFLRNNQIRVMPNEKYSSGNDHTRYIDVDYNTDSRTYEMNFINKSTKDYQVNVQYLPWRTDSGIVIHLKSDPAIFFTDRLTGCYLAFKDDTIVHLNLENYKMSDKLETLKLYADHNLLSPEDYQYNTTVLGIRVLYKWYFFYQQDMGRGKFQSGAILMVDKINKFGCKSVYLTKY